MDSYRFYLLARTYHSFCWMMMVTVDLVFMVEVAYLDPLQMVLVGTVLEVSTFLFEIPTGVVADVVSRKVRHHRSRHDRCGIPGDGAVADVRADSAVAGDLGCGPHLHQRRLLGMALR